MKNSKNRVQADAGDTGAPVSAASKDEKPPRPSPPTLAMVKTCKPVKKNQKLIAGHGGAGEKEGEVQQCGTVASASTSASTSASAASEAKSK